MSGEYVWVRYRHNTSAGLGSWEYMEVPVPAPGSRDTIQEMVEQSTYESWMDSDGYRGCNCETVDEVPISVIEKKLDRLKERMRYDLETFERLNHQLREIKRPLSIDEIS